MNLVIPDCYNGAELSLAGTVATACSNRVVEISYELNGGDPVMLCQECGLDPDFGFTIDLAEGDNTLTVTAYDDQGGVSSVSGVLHPDALPPTIACPVDGVSAEAIRPCGAFVEFEVTVADNCDTAPTLVCTPPSGSLFPPGETLVTCTATDVAGNVAECAFTVTVSGGPEFPAPTITEVTPAVIGITGGTPMTVSGTGFTIDDEVLVDGVPMLYPGAVSAEELQGVAPSLPEGPHTVEILRCGEIVATLENACQSGGLPRLFLFDPRWAFARGGNQVTIYGTNFLPTTQIRFGFSAPGGTENLLRNATVSEDGTTIIGEVPPLPVTELLGPRD
ncbi:MAG TPA: IPT/TIG domain-containing protein, partial [Verrucomicrobiae bacterium]|nr:IPT/TIG domain-containing protein [Verrucomicrobiae bacterium]